MARAWRQEGVTGPGLSELLEAGWRHLVAVPDRARLLTAADVTAVGFFGQLRPDVDHTVLFEHERRVTESFTEYAEIGLPELLRPRPRTRQVRQPDPLLDPGCAAGVAPQRGAHRRC